LDKGDTGVDPLATSLKKREKNGKILTDAVREIGVKPKVE
jgi:hypothetical protein